MSSIVAGTVPQHTAPAATATNANGLPPASPARSDNSSGLSDESRAIDSPALSAQVVPVGSDPVQAAVNGTFGSDHAALSNAPVTPATAESSIASSSKVGLNIDAPSLGDEDVAMDSGSDNGSNAIVASAASGAARSKAQRQSRGGFDEAEANPDLYGLRRSVSVHGR